MSELTDRAVLPDDVLTVLAAEARIQQVELTGSRATGVTTPLSDWDFVVTTDGFDAVHDALPSLLGPLRPVVAQWDRLSRNWCYMMILAGPSKIDLIFGHRHPVEPPWQVTGQTLQRIDDHFWDWVLWLGSKHLAGRHDVVTGELRKLHQHLLDPMGVTAVPGSLDEAVAGYQAARDESERRFRCQIARAAELTVLPSLRRLTGVRQ